MERMLEELKNLQIENVVGLTNTLVDFVQKFGFEKGNQFFWMDLVFSDTFKR
jgi:N-acetylglutamate synthase-like GNAT family acetyltransferase